MTRTINKDIEAYKEDAFKGLSFKECIYGGLAVAVASGIIYGLYLYGIPVNVGVYAAIPAAAPIALTGFMKICNMTLPEYVKRRLAVSKSVPLTYQSEELFFYEAYIQEESMKKQAEEKKQAKERKKQKKGEK